MGKFLQYSITAVLPIFQEYLVLLQDQDKQNYSKSDLKQIYAQCKGYESLKTKDNFFLILLRIIFEKNRLKGGRSSIIYSISSYGLLALYFRMNKKILIELIQNDFYNYDIYRRECELLYTALEKNGYLVKNSTSFRQFFKHLIKKTFSKDPDLKPRIANAFEKLSMAISSWKTLSILKEKNSEVIVDFYSTSWQVFALVLLQEFPKNKILIENIRESSVLTRFFMKKHILEDYINILHERGLLLKETHATLYQINLKTILKEEMVKKIISESD